MPPRKIKGHWYADFRAEGIRYRQRSPVDTRQGAAAYELALRGRILHTGSVERVRAVVAPTLSAFSTRWMNEYVRRQNRHMEQGIKEGVLRLHILPVLGRERIDAIRGPDVRRLKAALEDKGLAPKTVKNDLAILRRCLAYAVECEIIVAVPPFPRVAVGDPEHRDLTPEQQDALLRAAAPNPLLDILVRFKMNTGLRFSTLVGLRWSDVFLDDRVAVIRRSDVRGHISLPKNNRTQTLPLNDAAIEILRRIPRGVDEVFTYRGSPVRYSTAQRWLADACTSAGLPSIGWHALRHTNATELLNAGVPIDYVSVLLGHSSIEITKKIYARYRIPLLHHAVAHLAQTRSWARGGHTTPISVNMVPETSPAISLGIAKTST